jgi:PKD repeat protein
MWKYDPLTNYWTWMHGPSSLNNEVAVAGDACEFDDTFHPASRYESRTCWRDPHGNFWMFGGFTLSGTHSDLWVYKPDVNQWAFVSGSLYQSQNGFYGEQAVVNSSNVPSGKMGPVSWMDDDGNLWLFGGNKKVPFNLLSMNDVWKYIPDTSCTGNSSYICDIFPFTSFIANQTSVCQKFCTGFTDESTNNPTAWEWIFPGGSPPTSTEQNPTNICYNLPGTYDVTLITTNANGNDTLTHSNYITVYPTPAIPVITQVGYTLTSTVAPFYQWQFNATDIPGATNQSYSVLQTGFYTVIVSDSNGCENSVTVYVLITGIDDVNSDVSVLIYPNVSSRIFTLEISGNLQDAEINVVNTLGQIVFSEKINSEAVMVYHFTFCESDFDCANKLLVIKAKMIMSSFFISNFYGKWQLI